MSWSADFAAFHGWYLNLQEPLRTSRFGFDTMDLVLDVQVSPTGDWSWKDEDDFREALDRQLFDRSIEPVLRRHVDYLIGMLEERTGPFDERWLDWRPADSWTTPLLPSDASVA